MFTFTIGGATVSMSGKAWTVFFAEEAYYVEDGYWGFPTCPRLCAENPGQEAVILDLRDRSLAILGA